MTVERIVPARERIIPSKHQCELSLEHFRENTTNSYQGYVRKKAERSGMNPNLCLRWATHVIEGKHLCSLHAGAKVLSMIDEGYQLLEKPNE